MIRFDQVTKRYPSGQDALQELSFEVDTGEQKGWTIQLTDTAGAAPRP